MKTKLHSLNIYSTKPSLRRSYSTKSSLRPVFTLSDLLDKNIIKSNRSILSKKAGIYSFINIINGKQYIGSAKDLYVRLNEHLAGRKSNKALQIAITKYGLNNFNFYVYEYFSMLNDTTTNTSYNLITDLETFYIKRFSHDTLYNFMYSASSLAGYKHTEEAKQKMIGRFKDKSNHPFFGKHHTDETKLLISKPGELNPMFGKKHTEESKELIRARRKKYTYGVGIYDLDNNLVKKFDYASDLAIYLNISKYTVSKYLNKGLLYDNKYYFRVNPDN